MILSTVSVMEFFSANMKVSGLSVSYFTTVSQQMFTGIKHVADDKFVFSRTTVAGSGAARGEGGSFPPMGGRPKIM